MSVETQNLLSQDSPLADFVNETAKDAVLLDAVRETVIQDAVKEAVLEEVVKEAVVEEAVKDAVIHEAVKEAVIHEAVKEAVVEEAVKEAVVEEAVKEAVVEEAVKEAVVEEAVKDAVIHEAVRDALVHEAGENDVIQEAVKEAVIEEARKEVIEDTVKDALIHEAVEDALIHEAVEEAVTKEAITDIVKEEIAEDALSHDSLEDPLVDEALKDTLEKAVVKEAIIEAVVEGSSTPTLVTNAMEGVLVRAEAVEEMAEYASIHDISDETGHDTDAGSSTGHHDDSSVVFRGAVAAKRLSQAEEKWQNPPSTEILVEPSAVEEGKKTKPILCALAVCLGSFLFGTVIGWPSPAIPNLNNHRNPFHVDSEQSSWIGSVMTLGALLGGLCGGYYMDYFGRKGGLLYSAFFFAAGWTIIASSPNFACMMVGRALTGLITGIISVICPVYIGEIAPPSIRGLLGSCHQLAVCLGILFTYGFGMFLNWSWLAIACEVVILIMVATVAFIPESPRWLLSVDRREEAKSSLLWLRGKDIDFTPEILELERNILAAKDQASIMEFLQPQLWKPLLISIGLMVFQQWSGINVIMFYTVDIFEAAHLDLDSNVQTIIVGAVGVVGTLVSVLISDLAGRRVLLLCSGFLMSLSIGGMGAYFWEQENDIAEADKLFWLPITCLVLFNFGFDVAFGPIPWLMMSELFPLRAKGVATSVATALNWLFAFLTTKFFVNIQDAIGTYGAYWLFTGFCVLSIPFIIFFVPETKGKSLEEIERSFVRK